AGDPYSFLHACEQLLGERNNGGGWPGSGQRSRQFNSTISSREESFGCSGGVGAWLEESLLPGTRDPKRVWCCVFQPSAAPPNRVLTVQVRIRQRWCFRTANEGVHYCNVKENSLQLFFS